MLYQPQKWKHSSPDTWGWHDIITPETSQCLELSVFRLNLRQSTRFTVGVPLEVTGVVINGTLEARGETLAQFDSFYIPGGDSIELVAIKDSVVYLGAAKSDAPGEPFLMHFNKSLPLGDIHQIHGKPPYDREVFFTLPPQAPASRLIAGLTWSQNGAWTSWPPHQHSKDLEEAYFYFGPEKPQFGMQLNYLQSGCPDALHFVSAGDCVEAPVGYHPTVATPGNRNAYFWVMAARSHASRRYDLAVEDPCYASL